MCDAGVIDTGVLIGFTIKQDQHHETTKEYIVNSDRDTIHLPPRANTEFQNAEPFIRQKLKGEIQDHRAKVMREVSGSQYDNRTIQYIRDGLLDHDACERAYSFLYRYYTQQYKNTGPLMQSQLLRDLSNMEMEVQQDRSKQYGGWKSHIHIWKSNVSSYTQLKTNLLLPQSTDLDILIEAHHIADQESDRDVEFSTANPNDFVRDQDGEPRSREDDICDQTSLCNIRDLANPLDRHYPT